LNIGKYEIVDIALENLQKNTGISGRWEEYGQKELDGQIQKLYHHYWPMLIS